MTWPDKHQRVTWHISTGDVTHIHEWHDKIRAAWRIYTSELTNINEGRDMTHINGVRHDAYIQMNWPISTSNVTHMEIGRWCIIRNAANRGWISRVTHVNESCHAYEWVQHIWMSRVTHMNESCHTYEWVVSHIWMSRVTHMNESNTHGYRPIMLGVLQKRKKIEDERPCHTWMSLTDMNVSCHAYEWV